MSGCIPPDKKKYFLRKQVSVILHGCVSVYWIEMSNVFLTVAHWFKKSDKCAFGSVSSGVPVPDVPMVCLKNCQGCSCPRCTESESVGAELGSAL